MNAEQIAQTLTAIAQRDTPYIEVRISRNGTLFNGQLVAVHEGKILAQFGNRLRKTLPELRQAICDYLYEFRIEPKKRSYIETEIARMNFKSHPQNREK